MSTSKYDLQHLLPLLRSIETKLQRLVELKEEREGRPSQPHPSLQNPPASAEERLAIDEARAQLRQPWRDPATPLACIHPGRLRQARGLHQGMRVQAPDPWTSGRPAPVRIAPRPRIRHVRPLRHRTGESSSIDTPGTIWFVDADAETELVDATLKPSGCGHTTPCVATATKDHKTGFYVDPRLGRPRRASRAGWATSRRTGSYVCRRCGGDLITLATLAKSYWYKSEEHAAADPYRPNLCPPRAATAPA